MLIMFDIGDTFITNSVPPMKNLTTIFKDSITNDTDKNLLKSFIFGVNNTTCDHLISGIEQLFDITATEDQVNQCKTLWDNQIKDSYKIDKHTDFLEHYLYLSKLPFVFVTNIWEPFLEAFKLNFPWLSENCIKIYASHQLGFRKPNKKLYLQVFNDFKIPHERFLMVGDSIDKDLVPVLELGGNAIWYNPNKESVPEKYQYLYNKYPTQFFIAANHEEVATVIQCKFTISSNEETYEL